MKKITLFIALLCSISTFSARYLIQLGNGSVGATTWSATSGGTVVNLATVGAGSTSKSLNEWYADKLLTTPTFSGSPALASGDEIWLAAGTYVTTATLTFRSGVSIYGSFAGTELAVANRSRILNGKNWEFSNPTIIDGNNASRQGIITAASTPITYIDGLTITKYNITAAAGNITGVGAMVMTNWIMQNCIVSYNTFTNSTDKKCKGAGVYLQGGQLLNSYVHHNSATKGSGTGSTYGGGVAFVYNASPATTVKGCNIESNVSTVVGGGMVNLDGTGGVIEDCIFQSNSCPAGNGGAIGTSASTGSGNGLTLKNNQFIENTAGGSGGAVYYYLSSAVATSIESCSFIGNVATPTSNGGGGLCLDLGNFSTVKNCIFRDNKITNGYQGSALFVGPANTTVQNCVFANNTSAAANMHTVKVTGAGSKFLNCTFANNLTSGTGSALSLEQTVSTLSNCVFWNNYRFLNVATMVYRDVYGYDNTTTSYNATDGGYIGGLSRTGNIQTLNSTVNNTFVSPTTFQGAPVDATQKAASAAADWSLKSGCPAINTGTDLAASGITTDILGIIRPTGTNAVDRGAYEYGFTTAQTITFGALSTKTYGAGTFTLTATASSGLSVGYASSNTSVATVSGNTVTIVGAGSTNITATQAGNGSYAYAAATSVTQALSVAKAALTLASAAANSKVYDGTNTAVVSGALSGIVNPDEVTCTTGTFASVNVANAIAVTCVLSGAKAGNYSLTQPGISANITAASSIIAGGNITTSGLSDVQLANTDMTVSSGEMVINVGKTVRSITVSAGAKLSVATGQTLALTNLTLKSDAVNGTSTFVNDGTLTVTGTAAVEQYLATTRNWYVSSPVTNANAPAGYTYYSRYEPGGTATGWTPVSVGDGLIAGAGYIALPSTAGVPITFTTQGGGTLNSGNITIPITYTPLATSAKGYNLIGNPYPSHLTWTKTFVDNNASLIEPSIYYRTNAGSVNSGGDAAWSFKTYNSSTNEFSPDGTTNIIPPMQAFWVRAKASGNLILNSDLTKSHQTSNPLKAPAMYNGERQRVRLQVTNGTRTDETVLLFDSNAADGYDMFDSPKFAEANSEIQIYTILGMEKLVMNGMNSIPLNQEIALGFVQGSATSFSIKANEITNLPSDVRVILKDNVTKAETDLTDGVSIYQFTQEVTSTERFSLIFRTAGIATGIDNTSEKLNAQVFVNVTNQITIIAPEKCIYAIYNTVGQKQYENRLTSTKAIINKAFGAGVYFVKLSINGQSEIQKVIIR